MRRPGRRGCCSRGLLRNFMRKQGLAVDLAFGIEVDQDFGIRKALLKLLLDAVEPVVGFLNRPFGRDPDMELREIMRAAAARAQIVEARELWILLGSRQELLPSLVRPFAI